MLFICTAICNEFMLLNSTWPFITYFSVNLTVFYVVWLSVIELFVCQLVSRHAARGWEQGLCAMSHTPIGGHPQGNTIFLTSTYDYTKLVYYAALSILNVYASKITVYIYDMKVGSTSLLTGRRCRRLQGRREANLNPNMSSHTHISLSELLFF